MLCKPFFFPAIHKLETDQGQQKTGQAAEKYLLEHLKINLVIC